ncbi:toll/interleukin-1 receptor domain-containing protein [Rhodopseudomonas sp. P1]|uniref:toll/interleukin-1 receptor domain-containing protein n=1 Tax=Rhodopseudomonas sp. P1 TaxID=3434357 RepID=UPI0031FDEBBD
MNTDQSPEMSTLCAPAVLRHGPLLRRQLSNIFPRLLPGQHATFSLYNRYRFRLASFDYSQTELRSGEYAYAYGSIANLGTRQGSVYIRITIYDPYTSFTRTVLETATKISSDRIVLDSHSRQLEPYSDVLRQTEIQPGSARQFAYAFQAPPLSEKMLQREQILYTRVEAWQPAMRFIPTYNLLFGPRIHDCITHTKLIVSRNPKRENSHPPQEHRLFISYAWNGPKHEQWTKELATELRKHGFRSWLDHWDLPTGQLSSALTNEISTSSAVVILCTKEYAERWQKRKGGVGRERPHIEARIRDFSPSVIPVIVNDGRQFEAPAEFDELLQLHLPTENWRGRPFGELARAVLKAINSDTKQLE